MRADATPPAHASGRRTKEWAWRAAFHRTACRDASVPRASPVARRGRSQAASSTTVASGAWFFTDSMPLSREASLSYIWLLPITW